MVLEVKASDWKPVLSGVSQGNLNFKGKISRNVSKAFKMCGFIKRVCTTFTDVQAYISLVKSQLAFCSIIWNPWQRTFTDKIERVKKIH